MDDTLYSVDYPLVGGGARDGRDGAPGDDARPTRRSRSTPTTSATAPGRARRRSCRSSAASCRSSPTSTSIPEFGTGALKVTPGHDPNDFEIGARHGLEEIAVIGDDGRMTEARGRRYAGLVAEAQERGHRRAAREGLLARERAVPAHRRALLSAPASASSRSSRCSGSARWSELAAPAIAAVSEGRVRSIPSRERRRYFDWMEHDPAVVRLAPALVGPPAAGLVLRRRRDLRRGRATPPEGDGLSAIPTCSTPGSRRRCGRSRRSAGPTTRRGCARSTRPRALHRARHHLPLGGADDHDGHRVHRRGAVPRRIHPPDGAGAPTAGGCPSRSAPGSIRST